MSEVIFINKKGVHSIDGKGEVKPLFQPVKSDADRKVDFEIWAALKPVYFPAWVWQEVCRRHPLRYKSFLPVYQGQRVILT